MSDIVKNGRPESEGAIIFCKTGIYGKISGYYTGVAEYIRINE